MIEIDDAGSGSLVGGTGIGVMRRETEEYIFKIIPPLFFREPNFSQKKYQDYVIKITKYAFKKLGVSGSEPVKVCRSYIFDSLRYWLSEQGYNWENDKIEGSLQSKVEESFSAYVIGLGLPKNFVQHARYAFGFHRLLKWVFADYAKRSKLCKSGWKSWNKWSQVPLKIYPSRLEKELYCLRCGHLIDRKEDVYIIEYKTNTTWSVPLHYACCPYKTGLTVSRAEELL